MERSELNTKVNHIISEQFGVKLEEITPQATLSELGADSLDVVELVMAAEEEFDIEIPDSVIEANDEQSMTVEKFADMIQQQIG